MPLPVRVKQQPFAFLILGNAASHQGWPQITRSGRCGSWILASEHSCFRPIKDLGQRWTDRPPGLNLRAVELNLDIPASEDLARFARRRFSNPVCLFRR